MNEHRGRERRRFLKFTSMFTVGSMLFAQRATAREAEMPTAGDMEGPFYIANVPVVDNLNRFGKTGEPMRIVGRVMSATNPTRAVEGARIEIWQTDGRGRYYPEANGDYRNFRDRDIDMRGTVMTDNEGNFSVMSLFPKEYWPRPPHIHYWIRAEGFRPLVTQHYLDTRPGNRPHRTARVDRSRTPSVFFAPTIYLAESD